MSEMVPVATRQNMVFYCTIASALWGFGGGLRGRVGGDRWPTQLSLEKQVCPSKNDNSSGLSMAGEI